MNLQMCRFHSLAFVAPGTYVRIVTVWGRSGDHWTSLSPSYPVTLKIRTNFLRIPAGDLPLTFSASPTFIVDGARDDTIILIANGRSMCIVLHFVEFSKVSSWESSTCDNSCLTETRSLQAGGLAPCSMPCNDKKLKMKWLLLSK